MPAGLGMSLGATAMGRARSGCKSNMYVYMPALKSNMYVYMPALKSNMYVYMPALKSNMYVLYACSIVLGMLLRACLGTLRVGMFLCWWMCTLRERERECVCACVYLRSLLHTSQIQLQLVMHELLCM
jgi:hypothetical protein